MEWTNEQKHAIYEKNNNILVSAAAGSGKTAVLVERIINKIINERVDIDNLLVVTFTNAAASEMRERILKAIYQIIENEIDGELLNHLQKQIILLNKANICTIDSFCLDVIRNNFFEIDISPNFRIADNAEIELLKQETLEKVFEEKYENCDENFETLVKTYTSYRGDEPLKELVLKIYSFISSNPFPIKWLEEKVEAFNIKNINQDFSENQWGKILLNNMKENIEDYIKQIEAELRILECEPNLEAYCKILKIDFVEYSNLYNNLDNWDKSYEIANNVNFEDWPRSRKIVSEEKDKAKILRDNIKKDFIKKRDKIFTSTSKVANEAQLEIYKYLFMLKNLILDFDKEFKIAKKEKNIVDFNDIEHFALKILVKNENEKNIPTEIAKMYSKKFIEIAIDEYQDSNLVQEYILNSISRGNNIFMVGDVKQSIYKFRNASPELFLEKYREYSLVESAKKSNINGIKIQLFKNFRSRKNVINFTNLIFENIMSERLGEIEYTEEEYLNLGAEYEKSKEYLNTEICVIDTETVEEEKKEQDSENEESFDDTLHEELEKTEDTELEAMFVAQKIKELVENKFQIYDVKTKVFRDISYKDIVILLRSTKDKAIIYEKELINRGISVYTDSSNNFLDSYEIQIMMDLLKIIDNPYKDLELAHVMLSPIGMFTDDDLLEIRLCDKYSDFYTSILNAKISVSKELRAKIETFLNKIDVWREKNKYFGLDELIWTIYEDTGFLNYVALMPNGNFRVANLKILFERAKQYETVSFKGLYNFINFMEKVSNGSGDLSSAKIISENENVVRIMSIHKSKGLEFPVVFLSNTGSKFNLLDLNDDILLNQKLGIGAKYINYDKQIQYDTISKIALKEKMLEEIISEEMRVLYVALTRAKEKLFITGISKDYDKNIHNIQKTVDVYSRKNGKIHFNILKKYCKYLDWILLVYLYNTEYANTVIKIKNFKKQDIVKTKQEDTKEEINIFEIFEKESENITEDEIIELKNKLEFNYLYNELSNIPTKESVTNIVNKNFNKENIFIEKYDTENLEEEIEEKEEINFLKPKFLNDTTEENITPAKKGTIVHLCMKNLDFKKEYTIQDIKDLIEDLSNKNLITLKEKTLINPFAIFSFSKSSIFKELKEAKEYHKEEPFYINIPASEVMNTSLKEPILVQGIIDLYYINKNDELVLLDYKTDFAKLGDEKKLIDKHKEQLMIYKRALEGALKRKVDKVYIYSVSLNKEIEII